MSLDTYNAMMQQISWSDMVQYTDIKTQVDVENLVKRGYMVELTADAFSARFPSLPTHLLWFLPAIANVSLYFNPDTMAACPVQLPFLLHQEFFGTKYNVKGLQKAIEKIEGDVSQGDYRRSVINMPEPLQIEYLNRLVAKTTPKNLYSLFISTYSRTDFGLSCLSQETLNTILRSKTKEEERAAQERISELPDVIEIYRGGNTLSTPWQSALSWTTDINTASFFAARSGNGPGHIVLATIRREDVIDFISGRDESEILLNPDSPSFQRCGKIELFGADFLQEALPEVVDMYQDYGDILKKLRFSWKSDEHGKGHCARVLLLCLLIARHIGLSDSDKSILCTAAIYHDSRRENDWEDSGHGERARRYYSKKVRNPDPVVEFLCEYHCLPDDAGYKKILSDPALDNNRTKLLFDVFKDADALDRVRFGIKDLDVNQLRISASKSFVLVAKLAVEQLEF